jgi:hypothetical protein
VAAIDVREPQDVVLAEAAPDLDFDQVGGASSTVPTVLTVLGG